jgi:hypothetical protein
VRAVVVATLLLAACSGGTTGLGKAACPYLRPRLIRLDTARASQSAATISAVAQDIALYVTTNLPNGGKANSDQPLVRFSVALTAFSSGGPAPTLDSAEARIKQECAVPS